MGPILGILLLSALVLLQGSSGERPRALQDEVAAAPPAGAAVRPAAPATAPAPPSFASELLAHRHLAVPVQGVPRSRLRDNFGDKRGTSRSHKAMDIMADWGTPVLAADDGRVAKISSNRAGGLALYLLDPSGQLVYYYAHLAGYADGLREGQAVHRGDVVAYVGATGNAPAHAPHLHFAVMGVTGQRGWWGGEAINPYEALAHGEDVTAAKQVAAARQ